MRPSMGHIAGYLLLLTIALLPGLVEAAAPQPKRIVVIYDERLDFPGLAALDASLIRTLRSEAAVPPEIYRESLDLSRFGSPQYLKQFRDYLRQKYANHKIDVAIAVMSPSLDFLLEYGPAIFPGTPIVFSGIDRRELSKRTLPAHVTGVTVDRTYRPTLELALRLHPNTRRVVIVGGTSPFDTRLVDQIREELQPYRNRLALEYLTDLPFEKLKQVVATLPAHTIVLYSTLFRDGVGRPFVPHEALRSLAQVTSVPIYGFVDQYLGLGIVGGHLYSVGAHGTLAARLAQRVLAGGAAGVPFMEGPRRIDAVDWRELEKWRIDPSLLPPGISIKFREPSPWDQYHWYIVAALALTLLQASAIVALAIERARRRQSQQRYALASANGGVGVWDWNLETNEMYVDPFLSTVLGYPDRKIRNIQDWSRLVYADDAPLVVARAQDAIAGKTQFEVEHRMVHRDGHIRWFLARGSVTYRNGKPARVTGTETDITDRKNAEAALGVTQSELTRVSRLTTLGEFAASVAHEVRQPLTSIVLNVEASLRLLNTPTPDLAEVREALKDVILASNRADEVIHRNRELFRMHSVSKEPLDMNNVIREVAMIARPRLHKSHVQLATSFAVDLPTVMGDRIELEQVLLNLIANSIDATEHLLPSQRRVLITTAQAGRNGVQVCVSDNGVGLASVDLEQLFRLSYTTKPSGTGIGLSLCRSIVEAHGGRMWARANPVAGATFCFTIPEALAEQAAPASAPVHADLVDAR